MFFALSATLMYAAVVIMFLVNAWRAQPANSLAIWIIGAFVLICFWQTYIFLRSAFKLKKLPALKLEIKEVLAVMAGCLGTAFLIRQLSLSPVAASAIIGITGNFLIPGYPFSIFCGSFIGMTGMQLLNYPQLVIASSISGIIFMYARHGFHGMGGKLGVTAFIGVWAIVSLSRTPGLSLLVSAPMLTVTLQWVLLLLCATAAFVTYFLNQRWLIHIVVSSSIVGLVAVLLLSMLSPEHAAILSAAIYCASFAGMCNRNRLRGPWVFILVGFLSGLLFLATIPAFPQYGGKLGTIAFIAALAAKTIGEWLLPGKHDFICDD